MLQTSLVFILLIMSGSVNSTSEFMASSTMENALEEKGLILKAEILRTRIDRDTANIHSFISLRVRFRLENAQNRVALIVPKAVKVVGMGLALSIADLKAGRFVYEREHLPSFKQENLMEKLPALPDSKVISIGFQEYWEWETDYSLALTDEDLKALAFADTGVNSVKKYKDAWVQFKVMFWPHTMREEGEKKSLKWKNQGDLLIESLISNPSLLNLNGKV